MPTSTRQHAIAKLRAFSAKPPLRVRAYLHRCTHIATLYRAGGVEPRPYGSFGNAVESCSSGRTEASAPVPPKKNPAGAFAAAGVSYAFFHFRQRRAILRRRWAFFRMKNTITSATAASVRMR